MLRKISMAALGLFAMSSVSAKAAGSISWNTSTALALGSGCNSRDGARPADTFFLANGDDLSIVFSGLGINMPSGSGGVLADRKNCAIRVPANIASGYYIGQLTQSISYGITKTKRTRGAITSSSTFFNAPASPLSVVMPYGTSMNQPQLEQTKTDYYLVNTYGSYISQWCRSPSGIYKTNLAVSGQRDSDNEDLILESDALDLRFQAVAGLVQCPR